MEIKVEFQSGIPLVEQIAHQVMMLIDNGTLLPGEQLPTTRELAVKLGVNFNTVARAYRTLDQEGIISTQTGRGTFILDPQEIKTHRTDRDNQIAELTRNYIQQATQRGFELREIRKCVEKVIKQQEE